MRKASLGEILSGPDARGYIGDHGQWREIDLPDHAGAALVVWRMTCDGQAGTDSPKQQAQARRLVACWNACNGVSTEMLEELPAGLLSATVPHHQVVKELAEAREELSRLNRLRDQMKEQAGYHRDVSFDVVWRDLMTLKASVVHIP